MEVAVLASDKTLLESVEILTTLSTTPPLEWFTLERFTVLLVGEVFPELEP